MTFTRRRAKRITLLLTLVAPAFITSFVVASAVSACSSSSAVGSQNQDSSSGPTMTGTCAGFAKDLTVAAIWTSSDILSGPFQSPNASGAYTSGEDASAWPLLEISVGLGAMEAGASGFAMDAALEAPPNSVPDGVNVTNAAQLGSTYDVTFTVLDGTSETVDLTATCALGETAKITLSWTENGGPITVAVQSVTD